MTLIGKSDAFVFRRRYSGARHLEKFALPYRDIASPACDSCGRRSPPSTSLTPSRPTAASRERTSPRRRAEHADCDFGIRQLRQQTGSEFYSVAGAARLSELLPFTLSCCSSASATCWVAPSETALLMHDYLSTRGLRDDIQITFVLPLGTPRSALTRNLPGPSPPLPSATSSSCPVAASARWTPRAASRFSTTPASYDLFLGVPGTAPPRS